MSIEAMKRLAAEAAVERVEDGMKLGLGSGSTAMHMLAVLAARVKEGLRIVGVATSERTRREAERLGIPLTTLDETPELDLTIDGTDEVDPELRLIKGGGGALLHEKIVASASRRMLVIADLTKRVTALGRFPLPIEVVPFGLGSTRLKITTALAAEGASGELKLRLKPDGHPFVTDSGHLILDAHLGRIRTPEALSTRLLSVPGVVEHGLFIGLASEAILAGPDGLLILGPGAAARIA